MFGSQSVTLTYKILISVVHHITYRWF